ncbi:MAG: M23 family metallopeptidase, partial [Ahrensia sp.]
EQVDPELAGSTVIYGANVETEASIRVLDFTFDTALADDRYVISDQEAEQIVRDTAAIVTDGTTEVASLYYVDPVRFGVEDPALAALDVPSAARIVPMNISVAPAATDEQAKIKFVETVIDINGSRAIVDTLDETGMGGAPGMARALSTLLNTDNFKEGHMLRVGIQKKGDDTRIVRSSVYDGTEHILTIALNDQDQFVPTPEPIGDSFMAQHADKEDTAPAVPLLPERDLPDAYNAIYRGVLAYDLDRDTAAKIVRMVAADVDFRSRIGREDRLELFYSVPEEGDENQKRDVLYVEATFGGNARKFYRFISPDGTADYYDPEGRSARQFLLRNPVPSGQFRSGFGMRRHPILKYSKMHWGVDWSAPRGTPIISPGNGVVQKAGWAGGYGKQTVIKHANGYETSYSHQTRFAKGIQPGARVRQGQVIGYIGTTGLSTGPHLHYEMRVNGKRVDPMRVRLPKGSTLEGPQLEAFKSERDRIDALLASENEAAEVAALN